MADTLREPGIIGQMYENRRNRQVGLLVSRDAKFKTLMLINEEGKGITVNYSTFRSNYRKYAGEIKIEMPADLKQEAEMEKKNAKAKKTTKVVKEKVQKKTTRKAKLDNATKAELQGKFATAVEQESVNLQYKDDLVSFDKANGGEVVKYKKIAIFELWPETSDTMYFAVNLDFWDDHAKKLFDDDFKSKCEYKEKWAMQIKINNVPLAQINKVVHTMLEAFDEFAALRHSEEDAAAAAEAEKKEKKAAAKG